MHTGRGGEDRMLDGFDKKRLIGDNVAEIPRSIEGKYDCLVLTSTADPS